MTPQPHRYIVPGDIFTHIAICLMHASDAVRIAAIAAGSDPINLEALVTTLEHLNHQLGQIKQTLEAIVDENGNGDTSGSPRLC